ncbi:hemolysin family protein [Leptolyngbya ohadii]|uniref:hemolysin family protein n=1 Tax=Leptolyngbya ohadii TaxID=1962290 RepID=UPI000B59E0A8|nr:hemolysin family protein [Leptolyngbya ohadii]
MVSPALSASADTLPVLSGSDVLLRILAVLLLIAINGFFVAAEFSIVSVRRSRISQLVSAGDVQAKTVQDLQRGIDRLLSTTQIGITLSSLALGFIGESTVAVLLSALFLRLPLPAGTVNVLSHSLALPIAFLLIAYLQIVLGELCPKSVALMYPEQLARFLGAPSQAIARFFNPFIWILNQSTRWLLRLVGVPYTGQGWYNRVTPEELELIIATSTESPGLEEEERELLSNVFAFADVTAGEIMIPRIDIVALSRQATFQDLLQEVASSGHSRYPVMGESLDDIAGILHFKELAKPLGQGALTLDSPIQSWVRPAQFVSENIHLSELLQLMQRSGQPMAIVVDEFGGTAGLVTLQDLASEIMGESHEAENLEEPDIEVIDDRNFRVQAQTDLEEVNDLLNLELPLSEDYQTIGGFLIYQLQKIPSVGEILLYASYEMTVEAADGPRLQKILIHLLEAPIDLQSDQADALSEAILSETGDLIDSLTDEGTSLPDSPQSSKKQINR